MHKLSFLNCTVNNTTKIHSKGRYVKKNWMITCVILVFSLSMSNEYPTFAINPQTKSIYHRFYLVNRLEHTLNSLIIKQDTSKTICYENLFEDWFTHSSIREVVNTLIHQRNLSALAKCWKQFSSYRFIDDKKFEPEFLQLILMICNNIDPKETGCEKLRVSSSFVNSHVNTDAVANTFYIIQRLEKPIETICHGYKQTTGLLDTFPKKSVRNTFLDETKPFTHERIQTCIEDIHHSQSLEPIKKTYKEFTQYRYAGDETFLREQLSLLFFAYKVMLNKKLSNHAEQVIMHEMESIQYISQNIDDFSIDHILTAIDVMTDKLNTIHSLEKHEESKFQKTMYSMGISLVAMVSIPLIYNFMKSSI